MIFENLSQVTENLPKKKADEMMKNFSSLTLETDRIYHVIMFKSLTVDTIHIYDDT